MRGNFSQNSKLGWKSEEMERDAKPLSLHGLGKGSAIALCSQ